MFGAKTAPSTETKVADPKPKPTEPSPLESVAEDLLKQALPLLERMKKLESDIQTHRQSMAAEVASFQKKIVPPNQQFGSAMANFEKLLSEVELRQSKLLFSLEREDTVTDRTANDLTELYHRIKQSNKELLQKGVIGKLVQIDTLLKQLEQLTEELA